MVILSIWVLFFFKQKTAYEMRSSDWSSDVCSSDLRVDRRAERGVRQHRAIDQRSILGAKPGCLAPRENPGKESLAPGPRDLAVGKHVVQLAHLKGRESTGEARCGAGGKKQVGGVAKRRSEEHTSELKSLMRISYAVFCL